MPRKTYEANRALQPDPLFHSVVFAKFVRRMMYDGQLMTSSNILAKAFDILKEKSGKEPRGLLLSRLAICVADTL